MKLAIGKKLNTAGIKMIKRFAILLSAIAALFSGNFAHANDPDVSITPAIYHFQNIVLGTSSGIKTFKIKNTHASNSLNLGAVTIGGPNSAQFNVGTESCSGQTLAPDQECTIDVTFQPTSFGSKLAFLQITTDAINTPDLKAFLSNDEGDAKQAERRLPPVLFSVTIPETMDRTTLYNLDWSILGYHDSYESVIALFDCTGKAPGTCGANFSENFANSGLITASSTTPQPSWTFNGEQAVEHHYSYAFNADTEAFPQALSGSHEIVVRFYRKNNMDVMSGEASLSLLIPGNLSDIYYDNEGRRITKYITVP